MRKRLTSRRLARRGVLGMAVTLAAVTLTADAPAVPSHVTTAARRHGPIKVHRHHEDLTWDSYNWSGYAVTGARGSVTDVKGSWSVPTAQNCSTTPDGYASFWVGIDGFSSATVEQIGTDSDCVSLEGVGATPTYYAWFEFYPRSAYLIEFSKNVQPGDAMSAEVKSAGSGRFTLTLTDNTQGETFRLTGSAPRAQQSSAEWIAEAPCCTAAGGTLPLADFGAASFQADDATVGRITGPIGRFGANVQQITMVGENPPNPAKAVPSSPPAQGGGFIDTWVSAGP